jgi:hypothetical protein
VIKIKGRVAGGEGRREEKCGETGVKKRSERPQKRD